MNKITIIGLGLVGNSIGMGLRRASSPQSAANKSEGRNSQSTIEVVGLDPDRQREADALRRYGSVDAIAPDLERAVRGAQLVVVATPAAATREVFEAIGPYLGEDAVVTDTLASKQVVMQWAEQAFGKNVSFVGGHPVMADDNAGAITSMGTPDPDLFRGARWAIMPRVGARNESLNVVIWLAETLGASPLFIDPLEHDSYLAAANHLPMLAGAALWRVVRASPGWGDMEPFAQSGFKGATESLSASPEIAAGALSENRHALVQWVDRYLIELQGLRDLLAQGSGAGGDGGLVSTLTEAHDDRQEWLAESQMSGDEKTARLRAEIRQEIDEARPTRSLMGTYLSDRIFKKKEK